MSQRLTGDYKADIAIAAESGFNAGANSAFEFVIGLVTDSERDSWTRGELLEAIMLLRLSQ